jgi:exosortase A-associated hydrolase 2
MNETPFFFDGNGYRLFGVLHQADGKAKREGFVFCSPFGEEKLWTHRVFVNFARDLSDQGYPVLRFDYMGNGDSDGDFEDCSVQTKLSDIGCAIRALREKAPHTEAVWLLGLRFGATLALLASGNRSEIGGLILWEPIINGLAYMREMLRINISTQASVYKEIRHNTEALIQMMKDGKTVNVDGYEMSLPLYEQCAAIDLLKQDYSFTGSALLVQISKKEGNPSPPIKSLERRLENCETALALEEPFWKEIKRYYARADNLFRVTQDWIVKLK